MGFQQGLSGVGSAAIAIDVLSANLANAQTVGFKGSGSVFADVFANTNGRVSVGAGANAAATRQFFTQGGVTSTGNPLDVAISGEGFFVIERTNNTVAYTRNGQFQLDKDGFLVTAIGENVMGYQQKNADGTVGLADSGLVQPLEVPAAGVPAEATQNVTFRANLQSSDVAPAVTPFDPTDTDSYNSSTSLNLFDSLGNEINLSIYFVRTANPNEWETYVVNDDGTYVDNTGASVAGPASASTLTFDALGFPDTAALASFTIPVVGYDPATGGALMNYSINMTNLTQNNAPFTITELSQDGTAPGQLVGLSISEDGILEGRYSNGSSISLGRLALATFRANQGLASVGDNLWVETTASGPAAINRPGAGLNGLLKGGSVEDSNVDTTRQLVELVIAQRNYQANAQSIRTQDQILQTVINLR